MAAGIPMFAKIALAKMAANAASSAKKREKKSDAAPPPIPQGKSESEKRMKDFPTGTFGSDS